MRFGSLFSGIGGMDLGLERAGMSCAWQVEIEPFCRKVLANHWPNVARYNDVRECGSRNLEPVDLIAGGFPCQDISVAGKKLGLAGERSGLWREYFRIICELRPRYIIVENVAAFLIRGIDTVLGDLAEGGYDAEWDSYRASDFGSPHRRERIFIIAYPRGERIQRLCASQDTRGIGSASLWGWGPSSQAFMRSLASAPFEHGAGWPQPLLRGVDDGIPSKLARLAIKGYGNAVVPQVAEWIGKQIIKDQSS